MSTLPFADPIESSAAILFVRQASPPVIETGGDPYAYADANGNLIWVDPNRNRNGYVLVRVPTYAVTPTDRKVSVNVTGAVTITLPENFPEGEILTVWDAGANAGMAGQAITITPPANQQINSLGNGVSFSLTTNNARASLIRSDLRWNWV